MTCYIHSNLGFELNTLAKLLSIICYVISPCNELVGVMFIDFCEAFDLVDHKLLLEKLKLQIQSVQHFIGSHAT